MRRILRRLAWSVVAVVALLAVLCGVEIHTAQSRITEFIQRTGEIREGMTEAQVTAVAGAPDRVVANLAGATGLFADGRSCREANANAAMVYALDLHGLVGDHLGLTSGTFTRVVCLDARRIVTKTSLEMIQF
jgi:hypothetical protein